MGVEEPLKKAKCDLYWIAAAREDYDKIAPDLKGRQLVNRFPAMTEACNKAMFARLLKRAGLTEGEAFPFWPETWVIPNDKVQADLHCQARYCLTRRWHLPHTIMGLSHIP